jgi:lysophospholipase L1-like esterase
MQQKAAAALRMTALIVVSLLVFDIGGAQIAKRVLPEWASARAEKAARIHHPVYHHTLAANAVYRHRFGDAEPVEFASNSLGFRDAAPRDVPLDPGRPQVVLIGDSFTEGLGVSFEDSYAGLLAEAGAERGVSVLNAGITSYAPTIYDRKIRYLIEDVGLRIDHVVVFVDISDIQDEAECYRRTDDDRVEMVCGRSYSTLKTFKLFLKEHSILYRAYRRMRDSRPEAEKRARLGPIGRVTGLDRARWTVDDAAFDAFGRDGLRRATTAMDRLAAFLADRGVRLTVVVYPWPDQLIAGDRDSRQVSHWNAFCRRAGCTFVDAFAPFFDLVEKQGGAEAVIRGFYLAFDTHFNARGHALMAETVARRLDWPTP